MTREVTGWHVAALFGVAFGIIIAVNAVLAVQAVRTFPGLEVRNSYVASQSFDADRARQEALGWTARASLSGGVVTLWVEDARGTAPLVVRDARLGRTTHTAEDRTLSFTRAGGVWVAETGALAPGAWSLWLRAEAPDGTPFRRRFALAVPR